MSTTPPAIQNLARQLLAGEPARVESSNGDADQAVRACEKLRVPLTRLAGAAGFSSLLSRALALARLGALPLDTGTGFVPVQHLDPEHESALTQLPPPGSPVE